MPSTLTETVLAMYLALVLYRFTVDAVTRNNTDFFTGLLRLVRLVFPREQFQAMYYPPRAGGYPMMPMPKPR